MAAKDNTGRKGLLKSGGGRLLTEVTDCVGGAETHARVGISSCLHDSDDALAGWGAVESRRADTGDNVRTVRLIGVRKCSCEIGKGILSQASEGVCGGNSGPGSGAVLHERDQCRNGGREVGAEECKRFNCSRAARPVAESPGPTMMAVHYWDVGQLHLPGCRLVVYPTEQSWDCVCADCPYGPHSFVGLFCGCGCIKPVAQSVARIARFIGFCQDEHKDTHEHHGPEEQEERPGLPHGVSVSGREACGRAN
jgi:hypothetical protein